MEKFPWLSPTALCLLRAPRCRLRGRVRRRVRRELLGGAQGLEPLAEQELHLRDVQETWENQGKTRGKSWKNVAKDLENIETYGTS